MSTVSFPEHDDGTHRMRVADRYRSQSRLRKLIKILSSVQLCYVLFRTFWNCIPVVLGFDPIFWADVGIFVGGVALYPLYQYAFGYGRSQYEKSWAIRAYALGSIMLLGECFVRFWLYHVQFGPNAHDADVAAMYPRIPKAIAIALSPNDTSVKMLVFRVCDVFEKVFDIVGLGASTAGVFFLNEYVQSRKEAALEAMDKSKRS